MAEIENQNDDLRYIYSLEEALEKATALAEAGYLGVSIFDGIYNGLSGKYSVNAYTPEDYAKLIEDSLRVEEPLKRFQVMEWVLDSDGDQIGHCLFESDDYDEVRAAFVGSEEHIDFVFNNPCLS